MFHAILTAGHALRVSFVEGLQETACQPIISVLGALRTAPTAAAAAAITAPAAAPTIAIPVPITITAPASGHPITEVLGVPDPFHEP